MISPPQSVEQLLKAARGCNPADRIAFLDSACSASPELRHLVEQRLLAEGSSDGSTLDWMGPVDVGETVDAAVRSKSRFSRGDVIAQRFTVVRFIDRGGMGEVYEVEDRFLQGVHVALKMILPEIAGDAGSSQRFEQEVLLARKVTHPNLCPIYDIARSEDPPPLFLFLTMKLLTGETLSSRLCRPEPIPREDAVAIFRQMVAGLAAIHSAGVVHRDIKPKNVMLERSGEELCLSIMDFGLARLHDPETTMASHSLIAGTPGYIAPEVLQGDGPSQAADIFALGVLMHQVFARERPRVGAVSFSVEPSAALDQADAPPALLRAIRDFLANDPQRRCAAFEQVKGILAVNNPTASWVPNMYDPARRRSITRRQFAIGSAVAACAAAGGVAWKWDNFYDMLHPLPPKRFVALIDWPPPDPGVKSMLFSVVRAIEDELARAEAFDPNLLVIAPHASSEVTTAAQLNETRESLGANLVLAASVVPRAKDVHLSLRILEPGSSAPLREKVIRVPLDQRETLSQKAVSAAAQLLSIAGYRPDGQRTKIGTDSLEAYQAFQAAEALRAQENDSGLSAAIEKYKEAINLDPSYAMAQARLAWAYLRSYALDGDPAKLDVASLNCQSAIKLAPNLVDAHVGLASVFQLRGNAGEATKEYANALALDPTNPHTLTYQADFFAAENRWAEAEQTFDRVLNLRPNYWLGHQELGVILDLQGKYWEALIQFRSASLAAPRNALAIKNVGSVYLQLGKLQEALDSLMTSFQLKPDGDTATSLADLFRIQRRYSDAIEYAEMAVKLNPSATDHWLELGDVYSVVGRRSQSNGAYSRAATMQEEELRTSPKDGPGWMWLALCRVKAGETETALTLIAKAESLHCDDMDSQLLKVRILELVGRRADALDTIARCVSRGPVQFQLENMPDLEKLRATSEYKSIVTSTASGQSNF